MGGKLSAEWRFETEPAVSAAALGRALAKEAAARGVAVDAVVYASVVPCVDRALEGAVWKSFSRRAVAVTPSAPLGIKFKVECPEQVGADRILNALAAFERARGPAVVIDFGTATTFDCVSRRGDYLGGAILPGPRLSARALAEGTAQLPLVEIRRPCRAIGKETVECIQAGLYFGYLGMVEKVLKETLREMKPEARGLKKVQVMATGGLSGLFQRDWPRSIPLVPDLTLQGLRIAYSRIIGSQL